MLFRVFISNEHNLLINSGRCGRLFSDIGRMRRHAGRHCTLRHAMGDSQLLELGDVVPSQDMDDSQKMEHSSNVTTPHRQIEADADFTPQTYVL